MDVLLSVSDWTAGQEGGQGHRGRPRNLADVTRAPRGCQGRDGLQARLQRAWTRRPVAASKKRARPGSRENQAGAPAAGRGRRAARATTRRPPASRVTIVSFPIGSTTSTRASVHPADRHRRDLHVLRPDAHLDAVPRARPDVDRRAAHERGHEPVRRLAVEVERPADLLDHARPQHRHPRAHGHRLALVVGDVEGGRPQLLLQALQLRAGLDAELRVEVGERLVHQVDDGVAHDGPRQRHALLLAARELGRAALEQRAQLQPLRRLPHPRGDLRLRDVPRAQRERDVLEHREVRVERVVLEDHGHVALRGRQVVHHPVADPQLARVRRLQAGQETQQGGLAASRRPQQHQALAGVDLEVDVAQRGVRAEPLADPFEAHPHRGGDCGGCRIRPQP